MVFVEGTAVFVHQRVSGPGFGDHHHHGMGQGIAAHGQEFQGVVENRGVGLTFIGNGPEL